MAHQHQGGHNAAGGDEHRRLYQTLFEHTGTGMMLIEEDHTVSLINHRLSLMSGYTREEVEQRTHWIDFVYEPDRESLLDKYNRRSQLGQDAVPEQYEFRFVHKDGAVRHALITVGLIPESTRRLVSLIDISDRKEMELSLARSERTYRELFENANDIIYTHNLEGTFLEVNARAEEVFGYRRNEVVGMNIRDVVDPSSLPLALERLQAKIGGEDRSAPYELLARHRDGQVVHVEVNTRLVRSSEGAPVAVQGIARDVTQRRREQERLARSEQRFHEVARYIPGIICEMDMSMKVVFVNDRGLLLFGYSREDFAKGIFIDRIVHPKSREKMTRDIENVFKGDFGNPQEHCFVRKDGALMYLLVNSTPVVENGTPMGLRSYIVDITERVEAQERLSEIEAKKLSEARDEAARAQRMVAGLKRELISTNRFHSMISTSESMEKMFAMLPQIAQAATTVLITGESGTGKELVARSLHDLSPRSGSAFVPINCSALPDTLLESELFGYKAGAFTDAKKDKPGTFMQADGGTLFLDEIGDISGAMQAKLLRVLQERTFTPLGDTRTLSVDVRIVAATNRDLAAMVKEGSFREDLYYRIKVLHLHLPPLRERRSDIPLLCDHFMEQFNARFRKSIVELSPRALDALLTWPFPGNIRELQNIIEHAFIFCKEGCILPEHLPEEVLEASRTGTGSGEQLCGATPAGGAGLADAQRRYLEEVIARCGGNKLAAARELGIHKSTLFRKLKKGSAQG